MALPAGIVAGSAVLLGLIAAPEALLALPLAGAAGGAGWLGARAAVEARKRQIIETVDGVLDELTQHPSAYLNQPSPPRVSGSTGRTGKPHVPQNVR